jgi:hypothetical protein
MFIPFQIFTHNLPLICHYQSKYLNAAVQAARRGRSPGGGQGTGEYSVLYPIPEAGGTYLELYRQPEGGGGEYCMYPIPEAGGAFMELY